MKFTSSIAGLACAIAVSVSAQAQDDRFANVTIETLQRAAAVVGRRVQLALV